MKIIFIILCLFLIACNNYRTNPFDAENIIISDFPRNDTIKGEKLNLEILGVNVLYVVDTFLIGFKASGIDHFFEIYSLPNFQYLGKYISAGRGSNELITLQYKNQFQIKENEITMWVADGAVNKCVLFNLSKSLKQGQAVFDTIVHTPYFDCYTYQNDSIFHLFKFDKTNFKCAQYNSIQHKIVAEQNLFKPLIPVPEMVDVLDLNFATDPDGKKYVIPMRHFNQINILSADLKQKISVSLGEPIDIRKVINTPDSIRIFFYSSAVCTSDYIYALYINQPYKNWDRHDNNVEIQVLKYDGTPLERMIISEDIIFFAVDEKDKCIYGVNRDENIFRYYFKEYYEHWKSM